MIISIIVPIIVLILVIFATYFLYLWSTKKLNKDIIDDLKTVKVELNKNLKRKKISKEEMLIAHRQMELLRSNIDKLAGRFFLNKKQKNNVVETKNKLLEIEILFIEIRS